MKKKLPAAVERGKRGGSKKVPKGFSMLGKVERGAMARKGAASRIKKQTAKRRSQIAKKAAKTRWDKKRAESKKKRDGKGKNVRGK